MQVKKCAHDQLVVKCCGLCLTCCEAVFLSPAIFANKSYELSIAEKALNKARLSMFVSLLTPVLKDES